MVFATTVDLIPKSKTTKEKINKWDLFIKRLSMRVIAVEVVRSKVLCLGLVRHADRLHRGYEEKRVVEDGT